MITSLFLQSGLKLSPRQLQLFETFLSFFQEKNKEINLSAIRDPKDIIIKHFIDSLTVINLPAYQQATTVIDIGSGGGFPGIPLAIMSPEKTFTLVDSVEKKVIMINFFIQSLGLHNINTSVGRAEMFGQEKHHREQYDLCVSRAVAFFPTLLEYCLPFVKQKGYFIAYKEANDKEIQAGEKALSLLGGEIEQIHSYTLPNMEEKRNLVIIKKNKQTPSSYPREIGIPKKKPIIS